MFGYTGKMLFVNLSSGSVEVRELTEDLARNFLGGPALGAKILYDEMPPHVDAFAEESMVGILGGPLNATGTPFGGRYTVVSKSPVTGGWNDANSGGFFGPALKESGYDAIFVKGISPKPVYIWIDDGAVEIRDAEKYWGMTVKDCEKSIKSDIGDSKVRMALIGPAGEKLSYMAAVMNDAHRAAARGGTGAVMGSKKLKAIAVRGQRKNTVADPSLLSERRRELIDFMRINNKPFCDLLGVFGTSHSLPVLVMISDTGIKNWTGSGVEHFPEDMVTPLTPQVTDEIYMVKKFACAACPLACGAIYESKSEKWPVTDSSRPEYETVGAFGVLTLNNNMDSVVKCNELCNEYGVDTISIGAVVAWIMECYEHGVLTSKELDGIEAKWGDADAVVALTEKICRQEGCGYVFRNGCKFAGEQLGKGQEHMVLAGGIEFTMHDPRYVPGLARIYKYDPTPGRHVKGGMGIATGKWPPEKKYNYSDTGQADLEGLVDMEIINAAGLCRFVMYADPNVPRRIDLLRAVTGFTLDEDEYRNLGIRSFMIRQAFNIREGIRRKDHSISARGLKGAPPFSGPIADVDVDVEKLADNFFQAIGLDSDCVPTKEALEKLGGLENVIADIYPEKTGEKD